MILEIKEVLNSSDLNKFIDFPHDLYKGDSNYVPEIYLAMKDHLNQAKNPYFKHSTAAFYLAYWEGKIVGRISATINTNYNKFHNSNVGWFGFFDCIENYEVASQLLNTAKSYIKTNGAESMLGPANLTTNDTAGLLIDGFDSPPVVQMTYNKKYYPLYFDTWGLKKEMDMFAYFIPTVGVNEKALQLSERIQARLEDKGIKFRNVNMKKFKAELDGIHSIYNQAWENNWGFVPTTKEEFDFIGEGLKLAVDDRYVFIAEDAGKIIAFAVGLPDLNEIAIKLKKGRILPFGIFKLLFGKKKVSKIRIILLGVIPEYRKMGIEAVFFANFISKAKQNGLLGGEASWVLESNEMMVKAAEHLNGKKYKTYRIYSKAI